MIDFDLIISNVVEYASDVNVRAYVKNIKPTDRVEYYFSVSEPTAIQNEEKNVYSAEYKFQLISNAVFQIQCMVKVYEIALVDGNFVKHYLYNVTKSIDIYPSTITKFYEFDTLPVASQYDALYNQANHISYLPLIATIEYPNDIEYELPYYLPFRCIANYGIPPYTYEWQVDGTYYEDGVAHERPYDMFAKNDICSMAFTEVGDYVISCTVTDQREHKFNTVIQFRSSPRPIVSSYKFDELPEAPIYDGTFTIYPSYTPVEYMYNKTRNFYVGVCKYNVEMTDTQFGVFKDSLKYLASQTTNAPLFYERYDASLTCYRHITSRASVYFPSRFTIHQFFKYKNMLAFNMSVSSDYPIFSASHRLNQMIRFVASLSDLNYVTYYPEAPVLMAPALHYNKTINEMNSYIVSKWYNIYKNLEFDEVYDMVQMDVQSYLSKVDYFMGSTFGGLTGVS